MERMVLNGLKLSRKRLLNEKNERTILLLAMLTRDNKPHVRYMPWIRDSFKYFLRQTFFLALARRPIARKRCSCPTAPAWWACSISPHCSRSFTPLWAPEQHGHSFCGKLLCFPEKRKSFFLVPSRAGSPGTAHGPGVHSLASSWRVTWVLFYFNF